MNSSISNRSSPVFLPEFWTMVKRQCSYYKYQHWRYGQLTTIDRNNINPYNDGCPLKKYKPTHNNYKAFDDFVRKLTPPFFVKPPEPHDEKDVIYLHQVSEDNKINLPPSGGLAPVKSGGDLVRVIMIEILPNQ